MAGMTHDGKAVYRINCAKDSIREDLTIKKRKDKFDSYESNYVSKYAGYSDIAVNGDEIYVFYERFHEAFHAKWNPKIKTVPDDNDGLYFAKVKVKSKMRIEKLFPAFKDYVWGGNKLKEKYGKKTDVSPCAESWELSAHGDGLSTLSDGRTLLEAFSVKELGCDPKKFDRFPMLIKFIDAAQDLSVQVHPTDEYALKNEKSLGKTELWYVVEADEGAGLYIGFRKDVSKSEFEKAIRENELCSLLNFFEVKAGDSYFIPAGTVHAIGKGCLICEIQQNSNVTYRVYDHGRVGKDGKPRELHIDKALDVSDLSTYRKPSFEGCVIGECEYFSSYRIDVTEKRELELSKESFRVICCVSGEGKLASTPIHAGESFFVSACDDVLTLEGDMTLIVSLVP